MGSRFKLKPTRVPPSLDDADSVRRLLEAAETELASHEKKTKTVRARRDGYRKRLAELEERGRP